MSRESQHTHFEVKIQKQVRLWGFPPICASLIACEVKKFTHCEMQRSRILAAQLRSSSSEFKSFFLNCLSVWGCIIFHPVFGPVLSFFSSQFVFCLWLHNISFWVWPNFVFFVFLNFSSVCGRKIFHPVFGPIFSFFSSQFFVLLWLYNISSCVWPSFGWRK